MIEMEVAQEQAYEQRKSQKKADRQSLLVEGGKVVPDGPNDTQRLYMPGKRHA